MAMKKEKVKDFDYFYTRDQKVFEGTFLGYNEGLMPISEEGSGTKYRDILLVVIDTTGLGNNKFDNFDKRVHVDIANIRMINFVENNPNVPDDEKIISKGLFTVILNDNSYFYSTSVNIKIMKEKGKIFYVFLSDDGEKKTLKSDLARIYFPEELYYEVENKNGEKIYIFKKKT
jgi:hypothetical protein